MKKLSRIRNICILVLLQLIIFPNFGPTNGPAPAVAQTPAQIGKPIELSLNLVVPPTHPRWIQAMKPWTQEVMKRTGGRVKITPYFAAALAPFAEAFDAAVTGAADLTEAFTQSTPGRFPFSAVTGLSPLDKFTPRPSRILWDIYNKFPEMRQRYAAAKVLFLESTQASVILAKTPVRKLEDLKGMKILTDAPWGVKRLKLLGASGVGMPFGEAYGSLQTGVIDGIICSESPALGRKFFEIAKFATQMNPVGYVPLVVAMNQNTWKKLPKDIQEKIEEVSGDYAVDLFDKAGVAHEKDARTQSIEKFGVEYITLPKDEIARWNKLDAPIQQEFAAELESKGLPGKKLVAEFNSLLDKYSH